MKQAESQCDECDEYNVSEVEDHIEVGAPINTHCQVCSQNTEQTVVEILEE